MPQTYYLSSLTSDLSGGADFNRKLVAAVESTSSITVPVASASTEDSYAFTEPGVPGTAGATGDYSVIVKISANNATGPTLAIAWARVNSSGVQQAISSFTTSQAVTTSTQTLTFSATAVNLGTWASGDRLQVVYRFGNSSGGSRSFTVETGSTSAAVSTPFHVFYTLTLASISYALTFQSVNFTTSRNFSLQSISYALTLSDMLLVHKTYTFGNGSRVFGSFPRQSITYGGRR